MCVARQVGASFDVADFSETSDVSSAESLIVLGTNIFTEMYLGDMTIVQQCRQ